MPAIVSPLLTDICDGCGKQAHFIAVNSKKKRCCEKVTQCPGFVIKAKAKRYAEMSQEELSDYMAAKGKVGNKELAKLHKDENFVKQKGQKIADKIAASGGRSGANNIMYGKTHTAESIGMMSQKAQARPQEFYDNNLQRRIENGHIVPLDSKEPFAAYHQLVDKFTRRSWLKEQLVINPNNLPRGDDYELDHIVSIVDGFRNNVPPEIIGHHTNLRIIDKAKNRSKHSKSDMGIGTLIAKFDESMNITDNKNAPI